MTLTLAPAALVKYLVKNLIFGQKLIVGKNFNLCYNILIFGEINFGRAIGQKFDILDKMDVFDQTFEIFLKIRKFRKKKSDLDNTR